jgi:hypothetical protein
MPQEHREMARERLEALTTLLTAQPDQAAMGPLLQIARELERAIIAFHLEGIRFRMFTLGKQLQRPELNLPAEARTIFDDLRHSLEAAGFHTRSIAL